jgi:transcriptional regulator with XRE-family HTH domain
MAREYNHSYIHVNNPSCLTANNLGCIFSGMNFSERLRLAREHAGLTQKELVDRLGIKEDGRPAMSQANLAKLEKNPSASGSIYTSLIAKACGVNSEWLTNGSGEMLSQPWSVNQNAAEYKIQRIVEQMDERTKQQYLKIGNSLVEPGPEENGHTQPPQRRRGM